MGVIYWSLSMGIMGLMSEPLVTMGVVGDLSNRKPSGTCAYFVLTSPNIFCAFFGFIFNRHEGHMLVS